MEYFSEKQDIVEKYAVQDNWKKFTIRMTLFAIGETTT